MFQDKNNIAQKHLSGSGKQTITYDTDSICIIGSFRDEMSAYRARKEWSDILAAHFLLEADRDFFFFVEAKTEPEKHFQLRCEFDSACGRYAFWRLINHQAEEAEEKLLSAGHPLNQSKGGSNVRAILSSKEDELGPWVLSGGSSNKKDTLTSKLINLIFKEEDKKD